MQSQTVSDPSLEGDVAFDKADPSVCHQLAQVLSCSIFEGPLASWTANMCLDRLDLKISCHSGYADLVNKVEWQVEGNLVPNESPYNS